MANTLNKIILLGGFLSLLHAAYSAAQHRSYLRITAQEFRSLPSDIFVQAIISMIVIMFEILCVSGKMKPIQANVELLTKTWDSQQNLLSFYSFNHRGKALATDFVQSPKEQKNSLEF